MGYVVLYMGAMTIGYFIGSKQRHRAQFFGFIGNALLVCIFIMVLIMGIRMGSNDEIIRNLGTIGVQALIITVIVFVFSAIGASVTRRLMKIDKYGRVHGSDVIEIEGMEVAEEEEENPGGTGKMTAMILIAVSVGLAIGYFVIRVKVSDLEGFYKLCETSMTSVLTLMMFCIGLDMGLAGKVIPYMKQAGLKVMIFPFAVLAATTAAGLFVALILPELSIKEGLAVCYGYGWYTFAPIAIASEGYITASAIAFMHNVFRELVGLILIPVLAKYIGYIEVCSLPGVASMDIGMPLIAKSTRQDIIVYGCAMGFVEGILVPVLVPLAIG